MKRVLAIESSTALASVCLRDDQGNAFVKESWQQRAHSEFLNQAIEDVLRMAQVDLSQIDVFSSTVGPGSFTGLRVSGNIAKTFSYVFKKPIYAMTSLELLALGSPGDGAKICLINAFKNMVYAMGFHQGKALFEPVAVRFEEVSNLLRLFPTERVAALGDALKVYPILDLNHRLFVNDEDFHFPHAKVLAHSALNLSKKGQTIVWNSFSPLYIRASEAEESRKRL